MADDNALNFSPEWKAIFKKSLGKLSGKYYRSFLLDLAAIFLGLKPSLLFDYAILDLKNAGSLLKGFVAKGLISRPLDALKVGEDILFADFNLLVNCLKKSIEAEEFTLIDISGKLQEPRVLENETAKRVKKQCCKILEILQHESEDSDRTTQLVDLSCYGDEHWCVPSVFGFLLGYPVIYWCDQTSEQNCLSMVPLNRYTVTFKASPSIPQSQMPQNCFRLIVAGCEKAESCDHTVFSFTAPVALECHYKSKVSSWMKKIYDMGEQLGIAEHLTVQKTTVKFTQVTF